MEYCAIIQNTIFQIAEIIEPVIIATINKVSSKTIIYIEKSDIPSDTEYTNIFETDSSQEVHDNNNSPIFDILSLIHPDDCPLENISEPMEEYDNREDCEEKRDFWYLD